MVLFICQDRNNDLKERETKKARGLQIQASLCYVVNFSPASATKWVPVSEDPWAGNVDPWSEAPRPLPKERKRLRRVYFLQCWSGNTFRPNASLNLGFCISSTFFFLTFILFYFILFYVYEYTVALCSCWELNFFRTSALSGRPYLLWSTLLSQAQRFIYYYT